VLTRSLATTSCTLMPIIALLLFGGATLRDFAFALMIGVASGAYSSIFIASPVLTHWKERELGYRARRARIESDLGYVPAYAGAAADAEPVAKRPRRPGRVTTPDPETVSAAEFEQMKRDLDIEREQPSRHTSTLTKRLSHTGETPAPAPARPPQPRADVDREDDRAAHAPAPDIAENEGVAPTPKPKPASKSRSRNRRHGRRR
jgi:SecD/SecF fusion protein